MPSRVTAVVLVAVGLATVGVYVAAFTLDTTKDRPDTLDVEPVPGVAATACSRMRADLQALPPLGGQPTQQARLDRIAAEDRLVRTMITQIRAVGAPALAKDVPAEQWLGDWTTLADARTAFAAAGATGAFVLPTATDGKTVLPITDRMDRIGVPACSVPAPLTVAP